MAQYAAHRNEPQSVETPAVHIASPAPLGLGMTAILTAIVGCFYAGFIIPFDMAGVRAGVGAALLVGGLVLILVGMWEYAKGYLLTSTAFTSYGGVLSILGLTFLPATGIVAAMGGNTHLFIGLLFLCWLIYLGVLCIATSRINAPLLATLGVLFVAYFFLMLGSLARDNIVLLRIGGWLAIIGALVAWLSSLASFLGIAPGNEAYRNPLTDRLAVVE